MVATSDVEMEEKPPAPSAAAAAAAAAEETERKKALLVYKANQQSASDDDDDEEEDDEEEGDAEADDEEMANDMPREEEEDGASVKSDTMATAAAPVSCKGDEDEGMEVGEGDTAAAEEDDDDVDVDVDDEEGGVQVEKDDDESLNAPSDDDLDSTVTPRRSETDDDDNADENKTSGAFTSKARTDGGKAKSTKGKAAEKPKKPLHSKTKALDASDTDSASETASARAPSPSPSSASTQHMEDSAPLLLKSGATSNVSAIIAARRRTGARKECQLCHEPRNGRRALLCAKCKNMYHSSCFRQEFSKLAHSSGRQWFCPDCEPATKASAVSEIQQTAGTPRKRREDGGRTRGSRGSKSATSTLSRGSKGDGESKGGGAAGAANGHGGMSMVELELQRMTDLVLRSGKKINATVLEQTEAMLQVAQTLTTEIDNIMGAAWRESGKGINAHTDGGASGGSTINSDLRSGPQQHQQMSSPPPPPFLLVPASSSSHASSAASSQIVATSDNTPHTNGSNGSASWSGAVAATVSEQEVLLRRVYIGLDSLKNLLEQLQVSGIQFEVDLIKEVKTPPSRDERKSASTAGSASSRKAPGSTPGSSGRTASGIKTKNGASRLYSSKQIQKLEEWYQRSSRPESSEIQAMYRIINSPNFADAELQPEGISVKQIRIWFDNRRAKERLDYMRLKMKDISTTDMDADSVKKMRAAYIDEAKEVLEARVSRLREKGKGSGQIVDEADMLILGSLGEQVLPAKVARASPSSAGKAHGASNKDSTDGSKASGGNSSSILQKKRIRIDYVASVRKAVKDAREAGKSEEETKALRTAAIERARERLHVPYKNARTGPSKPLGKDEITHIKLKMLKLLEEDALAEELTDLIELLLSLIIPRTVLMESGLQQQLDLVLKAHKDNKELVRQTKKLQDEFRAIEEKGDAPSVTAALAGDAVSGKRRKEKSRSLLLSVDTESLPETPGSSPNSGPAPSPESRRPRVKFSLDQLVRLEKYFHKEDTPSKKRLDKIAARLNAIAARDPRSDEPQKSIDYKQIRCWFYKRRSANQPPQALSAADVHESDMSSLSSSSSDTESDTNGEPNAGSKSRRKVTKSRARPKTKASTVSTPASTTPKRKASPSEEKASTKRIKKEPSSAGSKSALASASSSGAKEETVTTKPEEDADSAVAGKHAGRIFNMKQLATIIEEYEKNPRPSVARLEELQKVLNQDDHADDHFVNALDVTKRQIKTWFSNRRAKERLDLIKMKIKETRGGSNSGDDESAGSETEDEDRDAHKKRSIGNNSAGEAQMSGETDGAAAGLWKRGGEGASVASDGKRKLVIKDDDPDEEDMDDEDDD